MTEGKGIVEQIAKLKYEVQHDRALSYDTTLEELTSTNENARPLPDDGQSDIEGYNRELAALGSPTWFSVSWLYAECYLYRYDVPRI